MIALSLDFTVIRVLFRFLFDRTLFRVLSDRVFFESSEIVLFSLGSAAANRFFSSSMLFFHHVAIFYQIVLLLFFIKNRCFVFHSLQFSKTISLTCFNNSSKTDTKKIKKYVNCGEKKYLLKICHQFPDLYLSSNSR